MDIASLKKSFPWDVFPGEVYQNFRDIATHSNIPLDYLGTQAIFTIASLSGNMYLADLNGGVKPIVFIAKIGPSGMGKTPAFHKICGDIITPLRAEYADLHEKQLDSYHIREKDARRAKVDFHEKPPQKRIRVIEGGTVEALAKHSTSSPAGFGVVYDEGERMFSELNRYNSGGTSIAFWNEAFNGKSIELIRVDSDRERFVRNTAISMDIGLQSDRLSTYFTQDAIESGILNRFLIVESDYIKLHEDADLFSPKAKICKEWYDKVVYLFRQGMRFTGDSPTLVPFTDNAKIAANNAARGMISDSNRVLTSINEGDATKYIAAYRSKLYAYFPRLALILAIYNNPREPKITTTEIHGAKLLCTYYEQTATKVLRRLFEASICGLSPKELLLYEALPNFFGTDVAEATCETLGLNKKFFHTSYRRKYYKGFLKKLQRGFYEK